MNLPKFVLPDNVDLSDGCFTFFQPSDSIQDDDNGQELTVRFGDAGAGKFLIIETTRWSLDADEVDKFAALLKQIAYLGENSKGKVPNTKEKS